MDYFYLAVAVICAASVSIFAGFYNRKNADVKGASSLYTLLVLITVFVLWSVIFIFNPSFDSGVLIYSFLFALCYTVCTVSFVNAVRTGPVALTSLFLQLSLIGVTVWGFIFWDEKVTPLAVTGLLIIAASICLCLYTGKREEQRISKKWLAYIPLIFIGNAGCSIVQRTQQTEFNGEHSGLMMLFAMAMSAAICFVLYLKSEKSDMKPILKVSWYLPVIGGACNVLLNLFVMILAISTLSPTLIYPVISVGGLIINMLFSLFVFKEKLAWWQWIGVGLGAIAVGILSI